MRHPQGANLLEGDSSKGVPEEKGADEKARNGFE
jgi:hypothetical protein